MSRLLRQPFMKKIESGPDTPARWEFDSRAYWIERGKSYFGEQSRLQKQWHLEQEKFILETVQALNPRSILELACGYGRITKVLADAMPYVRIDAYDLSEDQIKNAQIYCVHPPNVYLPMSPGVVFMKADILDQAFESFLLEDGPDPSRDVCVAIELFLHLDHADLLHLVPLILKKCRVLVHDFDVHPTDFVSPHVHAHDYAALYKQLGVSADVVVSRTVFDGDPVGLMVVRA